MTKSKLPPEAEARIERLKRLRNALGVPTQAAMANLLDMELGRWNHYERGMPIPAEVALAIRRRFPGITTDWIYDGDPRGLSFEMGVRLGEFPEFPTPSGRTSRIKGR